MTSWDTKILTPLFVVVVVFVFVFATKIKPKVGGKKMLKVDSLSWKWHHFQVGVLKTKNYK